MPLLRRVSIRLVLPLLWRSSQRRTAQRLTSFSATEMDSAWQILRAMGGTADPKLRSRMFQHALEDVHHASEFSRIAGKLEARPRVQPRPARIQIYKGAQEPNALRDFMAFAHVGEHDVARQFQAYAAAIGNVDARDVFLQNWQDEKRHAGLTLQLLRRTSATPADAKWAIRKVRLQRLYETWLRASAVIGEWPPRIVLSVLYLLAGLPLRGAMLARLKSRPAPDLAEHAT